MTDSVCDYMGHSWQFLSLYGVMSDSYVRDLVCLVQLLQYPELIESRQIYHLQNIHQLRFGALKLFEKLMYKSIFKLGVFFG